MSEIIDILTREVREQHDVVAVPQAEPCPIVLPKEGLSETIEKAAKPKPSFYQRTKNKVKWNLRKLGKTFVYKVVHPYRRYRTPAILGKLVKLSQELNDQDNFSIFLYTHGGCDKIVLSVYPLGYRLEDENRYSIELLKGVLPGYRKHSDMRLKDLHNTIVVLKQLSVSFKCLRDNVKTMQQYDRKILKYV